MTKDKLKEKNKKLKDDVKFGQEMVRFLAGELAKFTNVDAENIIRWAVETVTRRLETTGTKPDTTDKDAQNGKR